MSDEHPDFAEIEQQLERAELEETSRVCTYIEMPFTHAQILVDLSNKYDEDSSDFMSALALVDFALQFCDSLKQCMKEQGFI